MHQREAIRRRLGLQVLFDFNDIVEAIGFAAAHGFRALELNLGNIHFGRQLSVRNERERIRAEAKRRRVKLAIHAFEGPSFFLPNDRVRRCGVSELKRLLDRAAEIEARGVVMHLGFDMNYGMNGGVGYTHQAYPEYYERALYETLDELKSHARGRCRLCVENVGGFRYDLTHPILERVLGGSLGLCLDVGHVNVIPEDKRRRELAFFRRHKRFIYHSHLHDNSGQRDEHRVLGKGNIDFLPFFRLLAGTNALLCFEVRPKEAALECLEYYRRVIEPRLAGRSRIAACRTRDAKCKTAGDRPKSHAESQRPEAKAQGAVSGERMAAGGERS